MPSSKAQLGPSCLESPLPESAELAASCRQVRQTLFHLRRTRFGRLNPNSSRLNGRMLVFFRLFSPGRLLSAPPIILAALFAAAAAPATTAAQGTHLWTQAQMEEFEKGTPEGVAIDSDGHLRQTSGLTELLTTPSTFVWALAVDKSGNIFAATGTPATVLRLPEKPGDKPSTLFETKDLAIQALCLGPDGSLYASVLPSGKVFKLDPNATTRQDEATATVVFDAAKAPDPFAASPSGSAPNSGSHYIWDLTFDSAGHLYVATGNPAAIYRVDVSKPGATPELFFKSDEAHIRNLAWDAKGNLIAGSDGSGLVYRIDPHGKGYVLFQAPRREITSIAIASNGTIYAACVGDKSRNPLPPLPVQGMATISITVVQPQSLQAANSSAAVPEGTDIYALTEGQAPRKIWSGKDEIVYALAAQPDGLLALSGNRGRIFIIQEDGSFADIGHLQAQQGLTLSHAAGSDRILIGTGNTGKVYSLGPTDTHEYSSDVLDAGAFARFGRVEIEPGSSGYEILTRSGNVEQPVRGWTDWQPLHDGSVASPAGRFLQWKAVLHVGGVLGSVGANYLPVNAAPVVDEVVVVPGARINPLNVITQAQTVNITLPSANQSNGITYDATSAQPIQATKDRTAVSVRWAAHDDDSDDLIYSLYLRGDGESVWRLLKDKITDKDLSFDSTLVPDGGYRIKVVASDSPSHTPADALTGEKIGDRFVIDTTPPAVSGFTATAQTSNCTGAHCTRSFVITFDAVDAASPIAHAEYSLDAGPWQYIDPLDKISDSEREHYEFRLPIDADATGRIAEHLITVRAYDRYDNVGVAKTVIAAQGQ
jgi:sugar lactone lactonase YvrE